MCLVGLTAWVRCVVETTWKEELKEPLLAFWAIETGEVMCVREGTRWSFPCNHRDVSGVRMCGTVP